MKTLLPLVALLTAFITARAESGWKAGAAKVCITPRELIWMGGYASRNKPAEGTAQDLFGKALALEDASGRRLVIMTVDLIGVPRTLRDSLSARLQASRQLPPEGLLLNASHTHCGPEFRIAGKPGIFAEFGGREKAEAYGNELEEKLFAMATEALDHLAPATLTYHHSRCGFSMNRRLPVEGAYKNMPNPEGPVDQSVPVLRVAGADGAECAILFGYACHNTTLSFYQWCGDYAGYAQEYLEAAHPGAVALFVQGCAGDQNPYPRGKLELAQFHGRSLATAVEAALGATSAPVQGPLALAFGDLALSFAPQPDRAGFAAQLKSTDKLLAAHAQRMLDRLDHEGQLPATYAYPVQVVRFDQSLMLVALGGEAVVDFSLRLKRELTDVPLWMAAYSNDVMAYIPSKRVLAEGGYEGGDSMKNSTLPFPWAQDTEERIVRKVHELVDQVSAK